MSPVSELVAQSAARSCVVHRKIDGAIYRTPVIASRLPMEGDTWLLYKTENFQHTGSFKLRGASAKLTTVPLDRPVITASSGNHGIACSLAAQTTGHELIVVLPETVVAKKRKTIEGFGTKVVIHGADASLSELHAQQLAEAEGYTYISPYNDAEVIAGQGTAALELLDQVEGGRQCLHLNGRRRSDLGHGVGDQGILASDPRHRCQRYKQLRLGRLDQSGQDCRDRAS